MSKANEERSKTLAGWLITDEQGECPEADYSSLLECRAVAEVMRCSVMQARTLPRNEFELALVAAQAEEVHAKFESARARQRAAVGGR